MMGIKENWPVNYMKFYPEDGASMSLRNVDTHLQGTHPQVHDMNNELDMIRKKAVLA
jgi:hypothetical protein